MSRHFPLFVLLCAAACTSDSTDAPLSNDPSLADVYADPAIQAVLDLPPTPYSYASSLPAHFQTAQVAALDNTPSNNPVTDAGATLGRVLFYDTLLSLNETKACASCHQQEAAFTDPDIFSEGFDGGQTGRNSMSLINVRLYRSGAMFWDERSATLEHQVLQPIQDGVEMGMTLDMVVSRLQATEHYPLLFQVAFGDSSITSDRVSLALSQFVRSIESGASRYDDGLAQTGNPLAAFANFTMEENQGKSLFFSPPGVGANCAVCHVANALPPPGPPGPPAMGSPAVFFMDRARNNGLTAAVGGDDGVGDVTGNPQDNGRFKSPSLRNTEHTGPFMHDGSLATLRDVVEHYNNGIEAHPNLDPRLRGPGGVPQNLGLTTQEIDAVVAFLRTLSDNAPLSDVRFSDPFRQ